ENIVFVTGDTHSSWALEVTNQPFDAYDPRTAEGAYAVEFGTTSINSANSNERFTDDEVLEHEQKIVNSPVNPHLKYANLRDHGYLLLTLTKEEAIADWYYVETVKERSEKEYLGKRAKVKSGEVKLELE
ncbi:MAG: alkaline phosphatase D family protein, partial [Cyclobacteriaceae bacterium]|nr:alkaline phosphatase D family protein [Cyclobacteriaceae bacterium HetDA_MAG_MS6]